MPPQFLHDLACIDLTATEVGMDVVRQYNPQRGDMEQLDGIVKLLSDGLIARKLVKPTEFWVSGHIPDRPLLPGVLMIEAAAQASSFYTRMCLGVEGFIGFGGVNEAKFRQQVLPGSTLYLLIRYTHTRHRRIHSLTQGVVDGNLVFEGEVVGVVL